MSISKQADLLCSEPHNPDQLVFKARPNPSWISKPLKHWIELADIKRKITFHCFRHTHATLQLARGPDICTESKILEHTDVKATQIYAKIIDKKKQRAIETIKLKKRSTDLSNAFI